MSTSNAHDTHPAADTARIRHETAPALDEEIGGLSPLQRTSADFASGAFSQRRVLQLQRALGNSATMAYLRRGSASVQRAGDPEGMMKYHHAGGFTYHHIIPENKLHDFWGNLEENDHFVHVKAGLGAVVERGMAQLKEVGTINVKNELKKEIPELVGEWADSKFETIAAESIAGSSPDAVITKHMPELKQPDHDLSGSLNPVKTILNKAFKVIGQSKDTDVTGTLASEDKFMEDAEAKNVIEKMVMWMPGNIHRGPSSRFTPKDNGFDKDLDDGGSTFEEAAKQVISSDQYKTISDLNAKIDIYNGDTTNTDVLAEIGVLLNTMKNYSMTDYNADNWEQKKVGKKTAWRLKKKV